MQTLWGVNDGVLGQMDARGEGGVRWASSRLKLYSVVPWFEYETRLPINAFLECRCEGRWYLQAANGEDTDQSCFLTTSEIQFSDHGHGQDDGSEIRHDVDRRVGAWKMLAKIARFDSSWDRTTYNHMANWLMHDAGSLVQNARIGTQAKTLLNTVQMV